MCIRDRPVRLRARATPQRPRRPHAQALLTHAPERYPRRLSGDPTQRRWQSRTRHDPRPVGSPLALDLGTPSALPATATDTHAAATDRPHALYKLSLIHI